MIRILFIGLFAISHFALADNIGENFEAGSFKLNGNGSIAIEEISTDLYIDAGVDFYVIKGLSVGLSGTMDNSFLADSSEDPGYTIFSFGASGQYTFGYNEDSINGPAFTLGTLASISELGNNDDKAFYAVNPFVKLDYYLAPRMSLYVQSYPLRFNFNDENSAFLTSRFNMNFGISYSFARKDVTWGNIYN